MDGWINNSYIFTGKPHWIVHSGATRGQYRKRQRSHNHITAADPSNRGGLTIKLGGMGLLTFSSQFIPKEVEAGPLCRPLKISL